MTDLLIKLIPVFPLLAVIANGVFGTLSLVARVGSPSGVGIGWPLVPLHHRRV